MFGLLGDIHGDFDTLRYSERRCLEAGATALILVGDVGWYPKRLEPLRARRLLPTYFIDGNHEDHVDLFARIQDDVTEFWESGLFYVRRGSVVTIDGVRIAFLGGAGSIDKDYRLRNHWHWNPEEQITDDDVARLHGKGPVDLMVTHTPPDAVVQKHYETPARKTLKARTFDVSEDWFDPSANQVQRAWESLGKPPLVCGHFHESVQDEEHRVRILNIDELMFYESHP